jgi:hypothetical protein
VILLQDRDVHRQLVAAGLQGGLVLAELLGVRVQLEEVVLPAVSLIRRLRRFGLDRLQRLAQPGIGRLL